LAILIENANGALTNDVSANVHGRAGVVLAEVGVVIVSGGREVSVTRGEIESGTIFFQSRIAREAEGDILIAALLGHGGNLFVVEGAFLEEAKTFGQGGAVSFGGFAQHLLFSEDFDAAGVVVDDVVLQFAQ